MFTFSSSRLFFVCRKILSVPPLIQFIPKKSHIKMSTIQNESVPPSTSRNIEIKAKLGSDDQYEERVRIASNLCGDDTGKILIQHDIFYNVPNGRLKLRQSTVCCRRSIKNIYLNHIYFLFQFAFCRQMESSVRHNWFNTLVLTSKDPNCLSSMFYKLQPTHYC